MIGSADLVMLNIKVRSQIKCCATRDIEEVKTVEDIVGAVKAHLKIIIFDLLQKMHWFGSGSGSILQGKLANPRSPGKLP